MENAFRIAQPHTSPLPLHLSYVLPVIQNVRHVFLSNNAYNVTIPIPYYKLHLAKVTAQLINNYR